MASVYANRAKQQRRHPTTRVPKHVWPLWKIFPSTLHIVFGFNRSLSLSLGALLRELSAKNVTELMEWKCHFFRSWWLIMATVARTYLFFEVFIDFFTDCWSFIFFSFKKWLILSETYSSLIRRRRHLTPCLAPCLIHKIKYSLF